MKTNLKDKTKQKKTHRHTAKIPNSMHRIENIQLNWQLAIGNWQLNLHSLYHRLKMRSQYLCEKETILSENELLFYWSSIFRI